MNHFNHIEEVNAILGKTTTLNTLPPGGNTGIVNQLIKILWR